MKHLFILAALSLLASNLQAQKGFGKLVGGLEVSFDVQQMTEGIKPRLIPSLQLEIPFGRLAIGAGFGREIYHEYEYYVYAGRTVERIENEKPVLYYVSDARAFRPAYWTLPLKVEYRFHRCQCVFVQAGVSFDFFDSNTPDRLVFHGAELLYQPYNELKHEQLFKKNTRSYTFGIGFNLLARGRFRLVARPAFVLSENPEIYTTAPKRLPTFRMNFAGQFAFIKGKRR